MLLNPKPQHGGIQSPRYPQLNPRPISRPISGGYPRLSARPVLGSFQNGGKVKRTGIYKLHAGEKVMSLKQLMGGKC